MRLYEFAVVREEKEDRDGEIVQEAKIVVEPQAILARDDAQAQILAARSIPEDEIASGSLDRLTVVLRPF
jgi:hypothetical protein